MKVIGEENLSTHEFMTSYLDHLGQAGDPITKKARLAMFKSILERFNIECRQLILKRLICEYPHDRAGGMLIDIYAGEMRKKIEGSIFNELKNLREILSTVFKMDTLFVRIDSIHAMLNLLNFSVRCKLIPWTAPQLEGIQNDYLKMIAKQFDIYRS